ncbi:hypothetical protein T440DRAFT_533036 [Plenodomus tracheiphilus IPT5]|uniref:Uncharacterized protein n=1 Tax=Plenodomus tracheiphilus IPT5 TaxID=1408161 RepID=A0A6A7B3C4_9PLEO|nr:hypothetical protein T440DRAFT_533036 [Plenodomus tracheiphilus IPT5]
MTSHYRRPDESRSGEDTPIEPNTTASASQMMRRAVLVPRTTRRTGLPKTRADLYQEHMSQWVEAVQTWIEDPMNGLNYVAGWNLQYKQQSTPTATQQSLEKIQDALKFIEEKEKGAATSAINIRTETQQKTCPVKAMSSNSVAESEVTSSAASFQVPHDALAILASLPKTQANTTIDTRTTIMATQELISDILNLDQLIQGVEIYKDHCLDSYTACQYVNHVVVKLSAQAKHGHGTLRRLFQEMRQPLQYWHLEKKGERWCSYVRDNIIMGLKAPAYNPPETSMKHNDTTDQSNKHEAMEVSPAWPSMEAQQIPEASTGQTKYAPAHNIVDKMVENLIEKAELPVEMEVTSEGAENRGIPHLVHNNNKTRQSSTIQTPLWPASLDMTGSQVPHKLFESPDLHIQSLSVPQTVVRSDKDPQNTSNFVPILLETSAVVTKGTPDVTGIHVHNPMVGGMLESKWATEASDENISQVTKPKTKQAETSTAKPKSSRVVSRTRAPPAVVEKSLVNVPPKPDTVEAQTSQMTEPTIQDSISTPKEQINRPVAPQATKESAHVEEREVEKAESEQAGKALALQTRIEEMEIRHKLEIEEATQRERNLEAGNRKLIYMVTKLFTKVKELEQTVERQSQRSPDHIERQTVVEVDPKVTGESPESKLEIVDITKSVKFDLPPNDNSKVDSKATEPRAKRRLYDTKKRKALSDLMPAKTRNILVEPLRNGELRSQVSSKSTDTDKLCTKVAKQITHVLNIGHASTADFTEHARMLSSLLVFHALYTRANGNIGRLYSSSVTNGFVKELESVLFMNHKWMSEAEVCTFHRDFEAIRAARIGEDNINEVYKNTDRIAHGYKMKLTKHRKGLLCRMQSLEDAPDWRKKGYQAEVESAQREYDNCAARAEQVLNVEFMRFRKGMKSICAFVDAIGAESIAGSQGRQWIECEQLRFENGLIKIGKSLELNVEVVGGSDYSSITPDGRETGEQYLPRSAHSYSPSPLEMHDIGEHEGETTVMIAS